MQRQNILKMADGKVRFVFLLIFLKYTTYNELRSLNLIIIKETIRKNVNRKIKRTIMVIKLNNEISLCNCGKTSFVFRRKKNAII